MIILSWKPFWNTNFKRWNFLQSSILWYGAAWEDTKSSPESLLLRLESSQSLRVHNGLRTMHKWSRWCIIFWIVRRLVVYVMWQVIMNFHTGNAQTTGLADACFKLRQSIEAAADKTWTFLRRRHMALRLASSTFKKQTFIKDEIDTAVAAADAVTRHFHYVFFFI